MPNVLVFAETRRAELRKVALEIVTAGRALADALGGGEVHALLAGPPGVAAKAAQLGQYGADVILVCEHAGFATYARESIAATLAERAKSGYRAVLVPFSSQGRDLTPRVAARLDAAIVSDVLSFSGSGSDAILVKHPGYANKVIVTLEVKGTPAVFSVRPAAFTPAPNAKAGRSETITPAQDPGAEKVRVKEVIEGAK
ncbi:MAG: electron transfer flavoprotein subunit alpha/FixB family protein, partial [Gemmatimonadaceae bacterium]